MTSPAAVLNDDWIVPQWPAPPGVHAVCTTRRGGVSAAPYDSLNLGNHVGDVPANVAANRQRLQDAMGVRPVFLDQVHGTDTLQLLPGMPDGLAADVAYTQKRGLACTVMVADCLPILLCDVRGTQVAAVHAGWRGLLGRDGMGVVEQAYERFRPIALVERAQPAIELIAWLGPCIGPNAFEVGSEVRDAFVHNAPQAALCFQPILLPGSEGKWLADLPMLARQRLGQLGITQVFGNDGSAPWCTVGNPLRFFSHRRDRVSGRQAACIWLA